MNVPTREEALEILNNWVNNPNLKKHMFAVEAAMRYYAKLNKEDVELWGLVGLLHDFDYEKFPSKDLHPYEGVKFLQTKGYPAEVLSAILAHAEYTGEPRNTLLKKTIFAVDELSGLIIAVALVRPSKKLAEVSVEAVLKI